MPPYKYQPLDASHGEIRLVNLLPGEFADKIEVDLLHAKVPKKDRCPQKPSGYEALSYVWGPDENPEIITVRDHPPKSLRRELLSALQISEEEPSTRSHKANANASTLRIRQNLNIALRHLRQPDRSRKLWIDAISINQNDVEERNQEVGRMGEIYRKADRVIIWLGPEGDDSSLAIRTLRTFAEAPIEASNDRESVRNQLESLQNWRTSRTHPDCEPLRWDDENEPWLSIVRLFERTWFTRLWVIQECQLAAEGLVVAGFDSITLSQFVRAGTWVTAAFFNGLVDLDGGSVPPRLLASMNIVIRRRPGQVTELINSTKGCQCEEPRDRVYGIMDLLPDKLKRALQTPNYALPVENIYKDFFLSWIKTSVTISGLLGYPLASNSSPPTPSLSIPSWIPNLACPVQLFFFGHASARSMHDVTYSSSDDTLQVSGIQIAEVLSVGDGVPPGATLEEMLQYCRTCEPTDLFTGRYRDGRLLLDAFTESLVTGLTVEFAAVDMLCSIEQLRDQYTQFSTTGTGLSTAFIHLISEALPGRSFFTAAGGYFGIGPPSARPGDIVCVVLGFPNPVIFHPVPGELPRFQLRGECYVPGLMAGEGLLGPFPPALDEGENWRMREASDVVGGYYAKGSFWTQIDPRLQDVPLLPGWRMRFKVENGLRDNEFHPNFGELRFVNESRHIEQYGDPRLTFESLKSRGVNMEKLVIM
jgi:Heterokaryon incompatibility protein (HET)